MRCAQRLAHLFVFQDKRCFRRGSSLRNVWSRSDTATIAKPASGNMSPNSTTGTVPIAQNWVSCGLAGAAKLFEPGGDVR